MLTDKEQTNRIHRLIAELDALKQMTPKQKEFRHRLKRQLWVINNKKPEEATSE